MNFNPTNWLAALLVSLSPAPPKADPAKPAVVLVHGIYDSGDKMKWLAHQFQRAGYETFCPSVTPCNGAMRLEDAAAFLDAEVVAHFGSRRPLHIVGFSMGGLISRYWVAHFPVRERVISYATLSAPHHGTLFAYINRQPGVLEMRPHSPFLRDLATHDPTFNGMHPLSIYTPFDLIILPSSSSHWDVAANETRWKLFHPLMVFSPSIARRLLRNMHEAEPDTESAH
ncbi:MAG: alpha/beta fold hydrolase [Chthoniobacterales bacterium]